MRTAKLAIAFRVPAVIIDHVLLFTKSPRIIGLA